MRLRKRGAPLRIDRPKQFHGKIGEAMLWVCGSVGLWVCGSVGLWVCGER